MNQKTVVDFIAGNPGTLEKDLFLIPLPRGASGKGTSDAGLDFLAVDNKHEFVMIFVKARVVQFPELRMMVMQAATISKTMLSSAQFRVFVVAAGYSAATVAQSALYTDLKLFTLEEIFPSIPSYVFSDNGPVIDLGGDWWGWADTYDPFVVSLPEPSGMLYFTDPGCSIRSTRCRAFDRLEQTTFSVADSHLREFDGQASPKHEYHAVGRVTMKGGVPVLLPKVDPACTFLRLTVPELLPGSFKIEEDGANNLFLTLTEEYTGPLEYTVSTDRPISQLAFATIPALPLPKPHDHFGIAELSKNYATIQELVAAMQEYFSTYNKNCASCFAELESEPDSDAKIAYMISHRVGFCRHRAFLGFRILEPLGLPLRYLVSRTHAWLEIQVAGQWYYIDLGGCPVTILNQPTSPQPGTLEPPCRGERIDAADACLGCPEWESCRGRNVGYCAFTRGGQRGRRNG